VRTNEVRRLLRGHHDDFVRVLEGRRRLAALAHVERGGAPGFRPVAAKLPSYDHSASQANNGLRCCRFHAAGRFVRACDPVGEYCAGAA
jgi:hypothetical protein